ncbi:FXYD domain containing ion transport regulator 5 isoform X2 [Nerophis lumbriciformis]|uniref:FXYD domain containing ion transport regulator 5 isoform X2 n=1 Tax=Nerophis lumbriciformis TaxID=546530 RepID=UPI002ADF6A67|nr:uncharacterized protein LOC133599889 isoform X2 [Nerophis lumbriciformis]
MQNQVSQELNTTDREQLLSRFTTRWQQLQSVLHFTWRSSSTYTAAMGTTEAIFPEQRDFEYDEDTLRTTGMVLAIIMFVSGILIALSKKCTKCVKSSPKSADTQIPKTEVPPPAV